MYNHNHQQAEMIRPKALRIISSSKCYFLFSFSRACLVTSFQFETAYFFLYLGYQFNNVLLGSLTFTICVITRLLSFSGAIHYANELNLNSLLVLCTKVNTLKFI